jgi:hypothetical protein
MVSSASKRQEMGGREDQEEENREAEERSAQRHFPEFPTRQLVFLVFPIIDEECRQACEPPTKQAQEEG